MPLVQDSAVAGNTYTFLCPVVEREERYVACVFKRNKKWKGQPFEAQDCACAMNASRCPAIHMLQAEWRENRQRFMDRTGGEKIHRLPADILDRIAPIQVCSIHTVGLNLSQDDLDRINKRTLEGASVRPSTNARRVVRKSSAQAAAEDAGNEVLDGVADAETDMSNLLNRALEDA